MPIRESDVYRIAGQVVGALLIGAPIAYASECVGLVLKQGEKSWLERQTDDELLRRILLLLIGVAAQSRYGFGYPPEVTPVGSIRPREPTGLRDLEHADNLANRLSCSVRGRIEVARRYAAELVRQEDIWDAIEAVADGLMGGTIDGMQINALCIGADGR